MYNFKRIKMLNVHIQYIEECKDEHNITVQFYKN